MALREDIIHDEKRRDLVVFIGFVEFYKQLDLVEACCVLEVLVDHGLISAVLADGVVGSLVPD